MEKRATNNDTHRRAYVREVAIRRKEMKQKQTKVDDSMMILVRERERR